MKRKAHDLTVRPVPDSLDKGLELEWRFDHRGLFIPDHSGYNRHIYPPCNALTNGEWITTPKGLGFQLASGESGLTEVTIQQIGIPDVWTAITIEAYYRLDSLNASWEMQGVINFDQTNISDATSAAGYTFRGDGGTGRKYTIVTGGALATANGTKALPVVGDYIHSVLTYDGATVRGYREGVADGSTAATGFIDDSVYGDDDEIRVNQASGSISHGVTVLHGRIYNRALSASEVRERYQIVQQRMRPVITLPGWAIAGGKFASIVDTVGVTDVISITGTYVRALTESVGITDVLSKTGTFIKAISDSVGITDAISTSVGRVVAVADSVGITDIINAFILEGAKFASIVDTVGITDIVTTSRNIIKLLFDNVGVTDILSTAREIIKLISEAVGITDTLDRSAGRFVSFVESVGVTDALLTARNIIRSLSDSIGLTDLLSTARNLVRSISDSIGITDTIVAIRGVLVSLSDVVGITDTLSAIAALFIKTVLFLKSLLGIVLKQRSQVSTDVTLISRISTTITLISRIERGDN